MKVEELLSKAEITPEECDELLVLLNKGVEITQEFIDDSSKANEQNKIMLELAELSLKAIKINCPEDYEEKRAELDEIKKGIDIEDDVARAKAKLKLYTSMRDKFTNLLR